MLVCHTATVFLPHHHSPLTPFTPPKASSPSSSFRDTAAPSPTDHRPFPSSSLIHRIHVDLLLRETWSLSLKKDRRLHFPADRRRSALFRLPHSCRAASSPPSLKPLFSSDTNTYTFAESLARNGPNHEITSLPPPHQLPIAITFEPELRLMHGLRLSEALVALFTIITHAKHG
ncbi:hypothetical protein PIB30_052184 [Stylosanthes scabra]|uniref:Uncharacterized protein n=1 Tax=Stylosanthes scabra TaxID=79078 RepID=A0ABU6UKE2_9FABA|nr:hypothetical protein [Stylosanthes scabra]